MKKKSVSQILIDFRTIIILIILIAVFTALNPVFLNGYNLLNMLKRMSYVAITAFGMTFLLTLGVFDMSAGSVAALTGVVLAYGLNKGIPPLLMLAIVIIMAMACGLINGLVVVKAKIPAFLTTLASMYIFRGLAQTITGGRTISIKQKGLTDFFGNGTLANVIPSPLVIMVVFFAIAAFLYYKTKMGFYCRCIGGNEEAAKVAGINSDRIKIVAFVMMGLCSGFSGLILGGLMNAGMPNIGSDLAMDGIAAAVLGGTAISGGLGTMWGTVCGTLIMGILNSGLALLGAQSDVQLLVKGFVIVFAIMLDNALKSKKKMSMS